jgi:PAS domain S-box-containing protein
LTPINFQMLFEHSPNAYVLLDRGLRLVAANAAYLRVMTIRIEDLLGRYVLDVFPHDPDNPGNANARELRESFERVISTRETDVLAVIAYRVPQQTAEGIVVQERFWSTTHTPLLDDEGEVAYILQHAVEVTELQQLKEAVRAAEVKPQGAAPVEQIQAGLLDRAKVVQEANRTLDMERRHLRRLFEQAPGFTAFLRGPQHIFELANAAYYQTVGHREIIGKPLTEALPEVRGQGFIELLDQVFTTGEAFVGRGMKLQLQKKPDMPLEEVYVDFVYQPITEPSGAVSGIFVQGQDITEQKHLEEERAALLRQEQAARARAEAAEERHRFLAESIPQHVWTALPNGKLDFINRRGLTYLAGDQGRPWGDGTWQAVVHPDDLAHTEARWEASLKSGDVYEAELRLRRSDGVYRWHLARALAMKDREGRIIRWFGTNTDIDEPKKAQAALYQRSQFEQQLIGIVSHDLRNPLSVILMSAQVLLRREELDAQTIKTIARIQSSAERAARMIRDLLDFTKARLGGGLKLVIQSVDIHDVIQRVVEEVQLSNPEREISFETAGDGRGEWDADRLAQVASNLVSNAVKYGDPSTSVHVQLSGTNDVAELEVQNRGQPIAPEQLPKLFEPFNRGVMGVDKTTRSIGLGLYIVDHIVRAHGGSIDVNSTADQGTTFTVRVPRHASIA